MQKNKRFMLLLLSAVSVWNVALYAQESKGITYYKAGQINVSRSILLNDLKSLNGTKAAEAYYYLGEIYSLANKTDSAEYYYSQGLAADPSYVNNLVGKAKLIYKKDAETANRTLKNTLEGKNKKNPEILLAVAKAYQANGNTAEANSYIEKALSLDKNFVEAYILQGDILASQGKYGEASGKYEQALYFQPGNEAATLKYANVYIGINPNVAIQRVENLLANSPESVLAYQTLARAYYATNDYLNAIKAYEKYIGSGYYSQEDIADYAQVLFFSKDYKKSVDITEKALALDASNYILKRILMYNYTETKQYVKAVELGDKFFVETPADKIIALDHKYYGIALTSNKQYELGVNELIKALQLDSTKTELNKNIASIYEDMNQPDKSINYYKEYIKKGGNSVSMSDYFSLGKAGYLASMMNDSDNTPEIKAKKRAYLMEADSIFNIIAVKIPDNYLGIFWRARVNAALDPETTLGLAKPYYEQALSILEKGTGYNSQLIECYKYLGYYFYLQFTEKKDNSAKVTSLDYWNKILAISPSDSTALEAIKGLK